MRNRRGIRLLFWRLGDHTAYDDVIQTFSVYEPSFGTSLATVGRLGAGNNCVTQTDTQTLCPYIDKSNVDATINIARQSIERITTKINDKK